VGQNQQAGTMIRCRRLPGWINRIPSTLVSRALVIPGIALLVIALAACGGDDQDPTATLEPSPIPSPGATATPTHEPTPAPSPTATATPIPRIIVDPMPLISRDIPVSATSEIWPAEHALHGNYDLPWRAAVPAELVVDLSTLGSLGHAIVAWYSDGFNGEYDFEMQGQQPYNLARDYTLDVSHDGESWSTVVEVTGNTLHSRQHLIDLDGVMFLRLSVSGVNGSPGNDDVALSLDIHDARQGTDDNFIFFGDSITAAAMQHSGVTFSQFVQERAPDHFPAQESGGMSGWSSADAAGHLDDWLDLFPGRFVILAFGTNDAWGGVSAEAFTERLQTLIDIVHSNGMTPIIPTIPFATNIAIHENAPILNERIIRLAESSDDVLAGPDLYSFVREHPEYLADDGVHLTHEGSEMLRRQWAEWVVDTLYD
jgi:lysophospholipase L1-like esterase